MGKNSKIQWTHHTFNPWWGCTKVSPGCKYCYAETWSTRSGSKLWGSGAGRRFFGHDHWREPIKWNRESESSRERKRVFCASMADIFEARADLDIWRWRLWSLIEDTPWLNWLLLTKRPENIKIMAPWPSLWPRNVWLGITAETQEMAQQRIPILLQYPAVVKFVSCEPLLGSIELIQWLENSIDWVIVGGESGRFARPMHPSWVRSLRDQCFSTSIPFYFKQWGCWGPLNDGPNSNLKTIRFEDFNTNVATLIRRRKSINGRDLDGRTWDGMPEL
jgi:protein gp37